MDGKRLPGNEILGNLLGRIGVPTSWRIRAAGIFISAAKALGVIDQNGFLRYSVELHKARLADNKAPLPSESSNANAETITASAGRASVTAATVGAASVQTASGANVWVYSEAGGTVRLETPDPLPLELWKRSSDMWPC